MFQIIGLVRSSKYRQLYGEDPFHPLIMKNTLGSPSSVQHLDLLAQTEETDIDEQKRLAKLGLWPPRRPQVISVIPVQTPAVNLKWWQQQALDTDDNMANDSVVFRNWQRNELVRGVGGEAERKNKLNRKYADAQRYRWH